MATLRESPFKYRKPTARMADGGMLRTGMGGEVPGSGSGDKIPAKYEPGEFVVSNAMLDNAPGLRGQLNKLRAHTLAGEGKTVEEADARALGYDDGPQGESNGRQALQSLRKGGAAAGDGGGRDTTTEASGRDDVDGKGIPGRSQGRGEGLGRKGLDVLGADDSVPAGGRLHSVHKVSLRALDGFSVNERPWNGAADARIFAQDPGPGNPNVGPNGSAQAQAYRAPQPPQATPTAAAAEPMPAAQPKPTLRAGVAAQPTRLAGAAYGTGRALMRSVPAAAGVAALSHLGDYKLNDPDVDSSAMGTLRAARAGDWGGVGRSLQKGAVEAGMDLGSMGANALDLVVPGNAPVSTAYNKMLRNNLGSSLSNAPATATDPAQVNGQPAVPQPNVAKPTAPDNDPFAAANAAKLAAAGQPGPAGQPGQPGQAQQNNVVTATRQPNGVMSFSGPPGISGPVTYNGNGAKSLRNPGSTFNVMPAMPQAEIDRTLTNPDGSRWTSADNDIMAANIRDGVDPYRGTSRQPQQSDNDRLRALAMSEPGTPGRKLAGQLLLQQTSDATLRRGQDMDLQARMIPAQMAARQRQMAASIFQQANGDHAKAAQLAYGMGFSELGKQFQDAGSQQQTQRVQGNEANAKATEALHTQIASYLPSLDGKPDLDTAARYATGLNADLANKRAVLQQNAQRGDAAAAAALKDLDENGHAALSEGYKRNFVKGMQAADLANQYSTGSLNPMGGKSVISDEPITSLRKTGDGILGFGGEYTSNRGDKIPARAVEGDGSFFGGKRRTDLRSLISN